MEDVRPESRNPGDKRQENPLMDFGPLLSLSPILKEYPQKS